MVLLAVLLSLEQEERKREESERDMENSQGCSPFGVGCCVSWVTSISQL